MAKNRLLDRQVSLLNYLTSGAAIFGDQREASIDRALRGIDLDLLHLEAHFSYRSAWKRSSRFSPTRSNCSGTKGPGSFAPSSRRVHQWTSAI